MKNIVLVYKFSPREFMDIEKIIEFKTNLELVEKTKKIKMCFYGTGTAEDMSSFMSFFNLLTNRTICDMSFSLSNNLMVFEKGVNNKAIKNSARSTVRVSEQEMTKLIQKIYLSILEDPEIVYMPVKNWQTTILDFV